MVKRPPHFPFFAKNLVKFVSHARAQYAMTFV
jgi:hypothetical protein